jgi:hypothetical protein
MSAPRSDWHRVGAGLSVRFSCTVGRVDAEWVPRTPTPPEWREVQGQYRQARDQYLVEVSERLGLSAIVVVELGRAKGVPK